MVATTQFLDDILKRIHSYDELCTEITALTPLRTTEGCERTAFYVNETLVEKKLLITQLPPEKKPDCAHFLRKVLDQIRKRELDEEAYLLAEIPEGKQLSSEEDHKVKVALHALPGIHEEPIPKDLSTEEIDPMVIKYRSAEFKDKLSKKYGKTMDTFYSNIHHLIQYLEKKDVATETRMLRHAAVCFKDKDLKD